jgi:hypothetical protein
VCKKAERKKYHVSPDGRNSATPVEIGMMTRLIIFIVFCCWTAM